MTETRDTFELGAGLTCDLRALIDTRLLVQANSGGGKSWCLRRLLEQTHGQVQHLVIDPEGEFSTLRERLDYLVVGRQGADAAADPKTARVLAERLLELGVSAVLDIFELKAPERVRFVQQFLEGLMEARKELWHPVLVVVDEAHVFCPQRGEAESAQAVIDLATRGRKRGFCAVLATQRLSKLHKDAAAEANNKLIGRTAVDIDVARAADELGIVGRQEQQRFRELGPGEFFAFGPALSGSVKKIKVGPITTTHPRAGGRLAFTAPPPTATIRALLPRLQDLPSEPVDDRETLRREVSELRRQLAEAAPRHHVKTVAESLEQIARQILVVIEQLNAPKPSDAPVVNDEIATLLATISGLGPEAFRGLLHRFETVDALRAARVSDLEQVRSIGPQLARRIHEHLRMGATLPHPQQLILDALATFERHIPLMSRVLLAFLASARPNSSAFANNLGALRSRGLVDYPEPGAVQLTQAGRAAARRDSAPATSETLQARIVAKLPPRQAQILRAVVAAYPRALDKERLASIVDASATSSAFANNLGALRSLGLLRYPAGGQVAATPLLFVPEAQQQGRGP